MINRREPGLLALPSASAVLLDFAKVIMRCFVRGWSGRRLRGGVSLHTRLRSALPGRALPGK